MLKLPVCPHCHAVYRYKEVSNMKQGIHFCYHCGKKFKVNKILYGSIFICIVCILLIAANLMILFSSEHFIALLIMLSDLAVVTAAVLMLPLTVVFKAEKITKSEKKKMKTNH